MERESATHQRKEKVGSMDSFRQRQLFLFFFFVAVVLLLFRSFYRSSLSDPVKEMQQRDRKEKRALSAL